MQPKYVLFKSDMKFYIFESNLLCKIQRLNVKCILTVLFVPLQFNSYENLFKTEDAELQ
jgi:hypothetical protein